MVDPNILKSAFPIEAADLPTDYAVKMGHHANDHHQHKKAEDDEKKAEAGAPDAAEKPLRTVSPVRQAFDALWKPALGGAVMLTLFSGIFMLTKTVAATLFVANTLPALAVSAALAGAIWYGGNAAIKAYNDAHEHNQNVIANFKERFGLNMPHENEKDHTPGKRFVTALTSITPDMGMEADLVGHHRYANPADAAHSAQEASRPSYLDEILQRGPQSLSPKELAARVTEERAARTEHAV